MVDIVVVGTVDLFVDLLAAALRKRGFDTQIVAPTPGAVSVSVTRSGASLCLIDQRVLERGEAFRLLGEVVHAGEGRTRVVVLSSVSDEKAVRAAHAAGANGFVHTSTSIDGLVRAFEDVRSGRTAVCVPRAQRAESSLGTDLRHLAAALTRRERECLRLLVDGVSTRQMARTLAISELTVRSHVQRLLHKLGAHSRPEVVSLTTRYGLLDEVPLVARVG